MWEALFGLLVLEVGWIAARRVAEVWGASHGLGLGVGLAAVALALPMGTPLALGLAVAALKWAGLQHRRQLSG
jgi:hypothetical protein